MGSDVEKQMQERFRENLPEFVKKMDPADIISHLPCLTIPNREEIEARQTNKGRNRAVQVLFEILMRKKDGCQQLVAALRDDFVDLPELADLLDPHSDCCTGNGEKRSLPKPESVGSCVSVINKEQTRKPCDGATPVRHLVATVDSVYRWLDVESSWELLAGKLEYTSKEVELFRARCRNEGSSPAQTIIRDWCRKKDPTLDSLMKVLSEMERKDMVGELEKITNYKCPYPAVYLSESSLQVGQRVCEQELPVQTLIKSVGSDHKTDQVKTLIKSVGSDHKTDQVNCQNQVRTDRHSNSLLTVNIVSGKDNFEEITKTLEVAAGDKAAATVSKQITENLSETGHTEFINKQCTNMPNFGRANGSVSSEADYGDSDIDENADSSSSEESCDSEDETFQSDDSLQRLKLRYAAAEDGQLKMTAFGNASADETSAERTEVVPAPVNRRQLVVRQESVENYHAQTEPSMSSSTFVNLKQQRHSGLITPKMVCQRITQINYEQAFASIGSQDGYNVKLNIEEASTIRDFSEASVTTVPVVTEASGKSLEVGAFAEEDQASSLVMNSGTTTVEEARPLHPNSIAENDSVTDLNGKFLTLSLKSISYDPVHASSDIFITEKCLEELKMTKASHVTDGHNMKNGVIQGTWNPLSACDWTEAKVPYVLPQVSEVHVNKCIKSGFNKTAEHNFLNKTDCSCECAGDSNGTDSITELKEMKSHLIPQNQKTVLQSNNTSLPIQLDNKASVFLKELSYDRVDKQCSNSQENEQPVIDHKDNHSTNGHASFLTEVHEAYENVEHSRSRSSPKLGIRLAAGVMRTMALFNKYL